MAGKGNTLGRVVAPSPSANVPAPKANPPVKAEVPKESMGTKILDGTQLALDAAGMVPALGAIPDVANAGISALRGDWVGAGLSLAAAIPFAGWGATAAKVARRGAKVVAKKVTKEAAEKAAKEAAEKAAAKAAAKAAKEKAAREAAERAEKAAAGPAKEVKDGAKVKKSNSGEKGKCGEWLAKMDMIRGGFDEVVSVQNNSGHGVDLIGRNSKTGEVKVWEVKTTDGARAPGLSKAQASLGGKDFTDDRLRRASSGAGNYGKVPEAKKNAKKAKLWINDLGRKGRKPEYERREVFVDDLDKGCMKDPKRESRSLPWLARKK